MKKKIIIWVGLAAGLAAGLLTIASLGTTPRPPKVDEAEVLVKTEQEIIAQHEASKHRFKELERKMAARKSMIRHLEEFNTVAKETNKELDAIVDRKQELLANKPIRDGEVVLTDDELEELAEISAKETRIQEKLLSNLNTLKDL